MQVWFQNNSYSIGLDFRCSLLNCAIFRTGLQATGCGPQRATSRLVTSTPNCTRTLRLRWFLQKWTYICNDAAGRTLQCYWRGGTEGGTTVSIFRQSHLPLENFRLQAERSSTVVALQLHRAVGGERRLPIRGRLQCGILRGKATNVKVK